MSEKWIDDMAACERHASRLSIEGYELKYNLPKLKLHNGWYVLGITFGSFWFIAGKSLEIINGCTVIKLAGDGTKLLRYCNHSIVESELFNIFDWCKIVQTLIHDAEDQEIKKTIEIIITHIIVWSQFMSDDKTRPLSLTTSKLLRITQRIFDKPYEEFDFS